MTVKPVRLQLSRKKGFNLQEHSKAVNGLEAVNCARPSRFGNPFTKADAVEVGYSGDNKFLANTFWYWIHGDDKFWIGMASRKARKIIWENMDNLTGKNLACWCKPDAPCHADVLLELANKDNPNDR